MDPVISNGCKFAGVTVFLPYGACNSTLAMAAVRNWWLVNAQRNECGLQGFLKGQKGSPERTNMYVGNTKKWSEESGLLRAF